MTTESSGLDTAALARLANEFFAALPGQPVTPGAIGAPASGAGLPENRAAPLPAGIGASPEGPEFPGPSAGVPGRPEAERALRTAPSLRELASASFYFLAESRPESPRAAPALNLRPRDADIEPLSAAGIAMPRPPGASTGGIRPDAAGGAPETFYFLEAADAARRIEPGFASAHPAFAADAVRRDFPILQERVHGRPLVWLDNAATTQKPQAVIDRIAEFYRRENSNIHRAAHEIAARATDAYEAARDKVTRFLHASSSDEIVFVRGATEAINLVAQSWGRRNIGEGDEIVITWLEHHANIVPWQQLCAEKGARLRVAPVDDSGQVLLDEYEKLLGPRTRLVAFTQVSNALGTVTPAREMIEIAHRHGARVLLDGAQAVSHMRVDVQALDCDWYVFSGHKVFGPTGIGVLYGKGDLLAASPPWQGGGNMIQDVTFEKTVYQPAPARFEAGTGNIADAVGLGAAIDYLERVGIDNVARYEHDLLVYATRGLATVPGLRIIGTAAEKAGVISFVLDGFRPEEVGEALNREGIAVRAGHHCAQPILRRFGVEATVRPSLALYNTCADVDALVAALLRVRSERSVRR